MHIKKITTENDLQVALNIRKSVFIDEQQVPESEEFDQFDTLQEQCQHVLVCHDNEPVGTGRVRIVDGTGKLERICILKPYRKYGLGKVIIRELEKIMQEKGIEKAGFSSECRSGINANYCATYQFGISWRYTSHFWCLYFFVINI